MSEQSVWAVTKPDYPDCYFHTDVEAVFMQITTTGLHALKSMHDTVSAHQLDAGSVYNSPVKAWFTTDSDIAYAVLGDNEGVILGNVTDKIAERVKDENENECFFLTVFKNGGFIVEGEENITSKEIEIKDVAAMLGVEIS